LSESRTISRQSISSLLNNQGKGRLSGNFSFHSQPVTAPSSEKKEEPKVGDALRADFIGNVRRFATHIDAAKKQLSGDVRFKLPNVAIDNVKATVEDYSSMVLIEQTVEEWTPIIAGILESQDQTPKGPGAIAEITFWNERRAAMANAWEQLNIPLVKKMLEVLELADSPNALPFRVQYNELSKQFQLAEDNVKVLNTLERHFKNLAHGTIQSVTDSIPYMYNAIKMVWLVSRHYGKDEHLTPLLERIASDISGQVQRAVVVRSLFEAQDPSTVIKGAKALLEKWKSTYLEKRAEIENEGGELRWEFDRKRLFEQTDYMAERCKELLEVAEVVEEFNNIPMLKAVAGNSPKIQEVLRDVDSLVKTVQTLTFDIFDKRFQTSWEAELRKFHQNAKEIDQNLRSFINDSFANLRSAEAAFELLQNYKTIKTRPSINKLMADKFADVLKRYSMEIEKVYIFIFLSLSFLFFLSFFLSFFLFFFSISYFNRYMKLLKEKKNHHHYVKINHLLLEKFFGHNLCLKG